jgi:hypothetical protein
MRRDGERAPAIARMLETRRAVAIWRGERARPAAAVRPPVYSHPATQARSRRRIGAFLALAAVAAFAIAFRPWLGGVALLVAAAGIAAAARTWASRAARFALHAAVGRRWARLLPRPAHVRASAA